MAGRKSKRKGYRAENEVVNIFKKAGLEAQRIPLSGATSFQKGDVVIDNKIGEVKIRKDGFKKIYEWLKDNDFLTVRADRKPFLIILNIDEFIELLKKARG